MIAQAAGKRYRGVSHFGWQWATLKCRKGAVIKGEASDERERFEFSIEPFVSGGFRLDIRFSGDGRSNITGAGVWPSVEKAKQIAQATATRLLNGAIINWG
jgi:hypothetical protein